MNLSSKIKNLANYFQSTINTASKYNINITLITIHAPLNTILIITSSSTRGSVFWSLEFSILFRITFMGTAETTDRKWSQINFKPHLALFYRPVPSHLLVAGFLPLTGGGGTASGGRFAVAVFPAAEAVAGVVALLVHRGVVVFPLVWASAVLAPLSGGSWVRRRLFCCTQGEGGKIPKWKCMFPCWR